MSPSRMTALIRGQTGICRKVLDCVPIQDEWTVHQIYGEMGRLGHNINFSTLGGCLASLLSDGLIVERKSGTFRRVEARESSSARPIVNDTNNGHPTMAAKSIPAKPAPSPIEKLSQLAQQALRMADEMRLMASQIEQVAIEVDDQIKNGGEEAAKLRQLHALLKSLG